MAEEPSPQTVSALLILSTIFHGLAIIVTSLRLWFRYHIRRFWWDDFGAALALLCDAVCMVTEWTITAPVDCPYLNVEVLPTPALSRSSHAVSFWLNILFYTCSIWLARISIVSSVVRIVPPARSVSRTIVIAVGVFVCMWIYVLTAKTVVCATNTSWYDAPLVLCPMPNWVAVSEVCTDVLSDAILVALPMRLLWRIKLPSHERIMILSVFSSSILVSVISAVHTSYLIPQSSFLAGATAEIEGAVSLIVCNLLVVVTFLYRATKTGKPHDPAPGISDKHTRSSNRLTTVDLDLDLSGGTPSLFTSTTTRTGTGTGTGQELSMTAFTSTSFTGTHISFAYPGDKDTPSSSLVDPVVDPISTDVSSAPTSTKR